MPLPESLLDSLRGLAGYDAEAFREVHERREFPVSIRLNPMKLSAQQAKEDLPVKSRVPWTEAGYYLHQRPSFTFDPVFHAGGYYVQEASSMLLETGFRQLLPADEPLRVLDLCAAPGGKSTHLLSLLSNDSFLLSNEVIRNRAQVLRENIMKWAYPNVMVTQQDPARFASLPNYFDLIVVDAPCSGSGLFRRDPEAISEWSPSAVELCSQRQQRILSDILPSLKEGGWLFYSTCSYSQQEDEDIVTWLMGEFQMMPLVLQIDPSWSIVASQYGLRCWPDKTEGEGFFFLLFTKARHAVFKYIRVKEAFRQHAKRKGSAL